MGEKVTISFDTKIKETVAALADPGLLLVTQGKDGKPNAMAIGWGTIGITWGEPMFAVLVRPSRYSYKLLEENGDFTVNVMPESMKDVVMYCGTESGRDVDKFAEKDLTAVAGLEASVPIIAESLIAYECRTVGATDPLPETLEAAIRQSAYPNGDYHRIYYGKILCVRAEA